MASDEDIIILKKELQRIKRENLKLKMHMQVLVSAPRCYIARQIHTHYHASPTTTILN